jgi:hypothetical protein
MTVSFKTIIPESRHFFNSLRAVHERSADFSHTQMNISRRMIILALLPLLLVGVGLVVGGYLTDPSALTDEGLSTRTFLYIMGGGFVFISLAIMIGLSLAGSARQKKVEDLLATGQQGEATVLGLEDTGVRVNDNPQVRLLLEVHIEGYPPYQAEKTIVVPLIRLPQVQVGSTVQVLADPSEPDNPDKVGLLLK